MDVCANIRLVFFFGEGRLGNQLIQMAGLLKFFPEARIIVLAKNSAVDIFSLPRYKSLGASGHIEKLVRIFFGFILRILSKRLKLISYCCELTEQMAHGEGMSGRLNYIQGLFPICYAEKIYLQNFESINAADFYGIRACREINKDFSERLYVHVRRGDYIGFSSYGMKDIVLDVDYYCAAIEFMCLKFRGINSISFVTDDIEWCEKNFSNLNCEVSFISKSERQDFLILAGARYVVGSNSTFSLSAFLVSDAEAVVFPKYWFGRKYKVWAPPKIEIIKDNVFYV